MAFKEFAALKKVDFVQRLTPREVPQDRLDVFRLLKHESLHPLVEEHLEELIEREF